MTGRPVRFTVEITLTRTDGPRVDPDELAQLYLEDLQGIGDDYYLDDSRFEVEARILTPDRGVPS